MHHKIDTSKVLTQADFVRILELLNVCAYCWKIFQTNNIVTFSQQRQRQTLYSSSVSTNFKHNVIYISVDSIFWDCYTNTTGCPLSIF